MKSNTLLYFPQVLNLHHAALYRRWERLVEISSGLDKYLIPDSSTSDTHCQISSLQDEWMLVESVSISSSADLLSTEELSSSSSSAAAKSSNKVIIQLSSPLNFLNPIAVNSVVIITSLDISISHILVDESHLRKYVARDIPPSRATRVYTSNTGGQQWPYPWSEYDPWPANVSDPSSVSIDMTWLQLQFQY